MTEAAFTIEILESGNLLTGPWRKPVQMLHTQVYDSHASIHDDATAQKLGFQGGTIEGPTHFSQFAPLCERIWGPAWFATGCLSAHYGIRPSRARKSRPISKSRNRARPPARSA